MEKRTSPSRRDQKTEPGGPGIQNFLIRKSRYPNQEVESGGVPIRKSEVGMFKSGSRELGPRGGSEGGMSKLGSRECRCPNREVGLTGDRGSFSTPPVGSRGYIASMA